MYEKTSKLLAKQMVAMEVRYCTVVDGNMFESVGWSPSQSVSQPVSQSQATCRSIQ
jgi:hypothetical protein